MRPTLQRLSRNFLPRRSPLRWAGLGPADPTTGLMGVYNTYLKALSSYLGGSNNIGIDGAMIPHLFPGTKLNLKNVGTPGGVGTQYEESLLRYIAAGLGLSYEALSHDYSKTNYSSGKLATNQMDQFMASRKRHVADRFASDVYALVLEEMMADGDVPLPRGVRRDIFYAKLAKEAFCSCTWIGSGAGQVDEIKETQAALLRIAGGVSTHEKECAGMGLDWRDVVAQRAREVTAFEKVGVVPNYDAKKPLGGVDESPIDDGTKQKQGAGA
jgi:lambda family phage portal protein